MNRRPDPDAMPDAEMLLEGFDNLMPFRVQDILLVSSLYDSFILREDGRLNELLIGESLDLHLQQIPRHHARLERRGSAGAGALRPAAFNLIVTNLAVGDMDAAQLAREVKAAGLDVPVVVLAYDYREVKNFVARNPVTDIERIFLWQGNARILIAIVKYIEDKRNVPHDTATMGVPVMLVVEDNIRYYSSFLPVIYTELITQSRRVIRKGSIWRTSWCACGRGPRFCSRSNFEEAYELAMRYQDHLLGSRVRRGVPARRRAERGVPDSSWRGWCARPCPMCRSCCNPAGRNSGRGRMRKGFRSCASARPLFCGICGGS